MEKQILELIERLQVTPEGEVTGALTIAIGCLRSAIEHLGNHEKVVGASARTPGEKAGALGTRDAGAQSTEKGWRRIDGKPARRGCAPGAG